MNNFLGMLEIRLALSTANVVPGSWGEAFNPEPERRTKP